MSKQLAKLSLLDNALDFIQTGLEEVANDPDEREMLYGLLHLATGIELVLKQRLHQEHWTLIFAKPEDASRAKYERGDFSGPGFYACLDRLQNICGVNVTPEQRKRLGALRDQRNKVVHFKTALPIEALKAIAAAGMSVIFDFLHDELGLDDQDQRIVSIRETVIEFDKLVAERMKGIRAALKNDGSEAFECPVCRQLAATIDEGLGCRFCRASTEGSDAADFYASEVVGIDSHAVAKGADWPVHDCPECGSNSLVARDTDFVCFECGIRHRPQEMDYCERCGEPCLADREELPICDSCTEHLIPDD